MIITHDDFIPFYYLVQLLRGVTEDFLWPMTLETSPAHLPVRGLACRFVMSGGRRDNYGCGLSASTFWRDARSGGIRWFLIVVGNHADSSLEPRIAPEAKRAGMRLTSPGLGAPGGRPDRDLPSRVNR